MYKNNVDELNKIVDSMKNMFGNMYLFIDGYGELISKAIKHKDNNMYDLEKINRNLIEINNFILKHNENVQNEIYENT